MKGRYPAFDISKVQLLPLDRRAHELTGDFIRPLISPPGPGDPSFRKVGQAILTGRSEGTNTVFLCGGHVVRSGVQRYLIDFLERGLVQGIAVNGAVAVHDFEIALQGATTESVARYIRQGQFGLWRETGRINSILKEGGADGLGFGESLARELAEGAYPYKHCSLFAAAWRNGVPVTVHVGIGYDIIHAHPNFDGGITGAASHRDFLIFAHIIENLSCLCSFGSAVMAPEVFLKALSMVRNVALNQGKGFKPFTSLVCDLVNIPENAGQEASKDDPRYYFRPWKTLLVRTQVEGGESYYVRGPHAETIPALWHAVNTLEMRNG